ncbi:hypothetical protein J437_LFUL017172 [Ladona fulva]|uniref:TIMELESS-interacting protein n=1 Tax=Ladona fulva TaxID=123851 RepID=A0A8K0KQ77_LADFU|nr:hypothetical protein J437_LFUL017172 [Ladona fulva]
MLEGDEYEDHLLGDPNQLDDLIEGRDLENEDENVAEEAGNDPGSGDEKKEKKTIKRVLNPQPKLDKDRLTGPKGIVAIEGLFKKFEFCGAGYEDHNLNRIMKRLELWGNRLFPKLQFDDLLEKVEKLGHKRPVLNFVSKVRMGLVDEETVAENSKENGDVVDVEDIDENEDAGNTNDDVFEQLLAEQQSQINSRPVQINLPPPETTITEEQRERMLRNRKLAEERRLARIKAQQERELQNAENIPVPKITTEAEFDRVADLELGNIPTTHSVQHGSDKVEVSSTRNTKNEEQLQSENVIENIDKVDPSTQGSEEVSNIEKVEATELHDNESKKGNIDMSDGIEGRAEVSIDESHNKCDEPMEVNCINSIVNHHMNETDANICVEHTLLDDDESIKAFELKGDVQTVEDPSEDSEME